MTEKEKQNLRNEFKLSTIFSEIRIQDQKDKKGLIRGIQLFKNMYKTDKSTRVKDIIEGLTTQLERLNASMELYNIPL